MRGKMIALLKSLRLGVILVVSYAKNHWLLFLLGIGVGIVSLQFLPKLTGSRIEIVGLAGDYTISSLPLEIQNEISFGLTQISAGGKIVPAAAKSWEISDSGKTFTFLLNPGLKWQNGEKFDAEGVNYNLKSVQLSRPAADKIRLNLKEPFAPILSVASQPLFKSGLVGLGLWQVRSITFNGKFISTLALTNNQTGERKIYKFFPTEESVILGLKLGSITRANNLHQTFHVERDRHYELSSKIAASTIATIFFNLEKEKFADKPLRQALTYALPDNSPFGLPADSPLPKNSWYESLLVKKYQQNVELSKKLLQKSSSESAKFKMVLSATKPLEKTANEIAKAWQNVGVETSVEIADVPPPNFDAFLAYLEVPPDPDQYPIWHSTQRTNISHYNSPKVDKLLEEGRRALDPKERKEIYSNFQKALSEDVPAIFLYYPTLYTITRN